MKTQVKTEKSPMRRLAQFVIGASLVASTASLLAGPDKDSSKQLAEKIRENIEENEGAMQDLIRRAAENGGQLQLDMEEFEKLMNQPARKPDSSQSTQQELQEFLRKMQAGAKSRALDPDEADRLSGPDWMQRLGERTAEEGSAPEKKTDAVKGFLEMFQRQVNGRKAGKNEREHGSVLAEYRPVIEQARKSTVGLFAGRKQVSLGTVVDARGYVITKASEVDGKDLRCVFPGGRRVAAEVLDVYEPLDLALVKVEADHLETVEWSDSGELELGSFLASPGIGKDPIAIGVASVAPRSLSESTKGYLGVAPEGGDGGVRIGQVLQGTPAAKAGLKVGDLVVEIDDNKLKGRAEFHRLIAGRSPGEKVRFKVMRDGEEKNLTAKLASREEFAPQIRGGRSNPRIDRMNSMGGKLSDNRGGYPSAMQTDLTLGPEECGGPVVNLDGEVVGVNIARGGRVKSYAVPAKDLRALLGDVESGKFTITDLTDLKSAAVTAGLNLKKAEEALKKAREAKAAADSALQAAAEK